MTHRDHKRTPQHKTRTLNRRALRRLKSAQLFLCVAFPAPSFPIAR